jgi:hypothetical protein
MDTRAKVPHSATLREANLRQILYFSYYKFALFTVSPWPACQVGSLGRTLRYLYKTGEPWISWTVHERQPWKDLHFQWQLGFYGAVEQGPRSTLLSSTSFLLLVAGLQAIKHLLK